MTSKETKKMNIHERLNYIQQNLKAPKGQRNSFGNYNYRSCEDIMEAVKPLLGDSVLIVGDEIVRKGERYYVKATATLLLKNGEETHASLMSTAYAREAEDKKGMDASQITGATSSYARKYALNGLFAIDDTRDADTMDNRKDAQDTKKTTRQPTESTTRCQMHDCDMVQSPRGTWYHKDPDEVAEGICVGKGYFTAKGK